MIGVCTSPLPLLPEASRESGGCLGLHYGGAGWGFYGYERYGRKHHNGQILSYAPTFSGFKPGDTVEVQLSGEGQLRFIVNKIDLGVAFENVHGDVVGALTFGAGGQIVEFLG